MLLLSLEGSYSGYRLIFWRLFLSGKEVHILSNEDMSLITSVTRIYKCSSYQLIKQSLVRAHLYSKIESRPTDYAVINVCITELRIILIKTFSLHCVYNPLLDDQANLPIMHHFDNSYKMLLLSHTGLTVFWGKIYFEWYCICTVNECWCKM